MAKKLLFNNVISDDGELTPIMDGLICWLDARDCSGQQTTWIDRMGNYNFELLQNFNSDFVSWTGTSFNVKELNSPTSRYGFKNENLNLLNFTFQFNYYLLRLRDNSSYPYIFSANSRLLKLWMELNLFKIMTYLVINDSEPIINNNYIITVTYENKELKLYKNSKLILEKTINKLPIINTLTIYQDEYSSDTTARQIIGDYYSFAMYNRVLSQEEIVKNYQYETSIAR